MPDFINYIIYDFASKVNIFSHIFLQHYENDEKFLHKMKKTIYFSE